MKRRLMSVAGTILGLLVLAYFVYGIGLFLLQDRMLFPAPDLCDAWLAQEAQRHHAREFWVSTSDGVKIYGWHRPSEGRRAVLYFHGNASSPAAAVDLQNDLARRGWDFVGIAYRGYPGSEGKPSEQGIHLDALAAWKWTVEELNIAPDNIVIHGRSLGGGVAAHLAAEVKPGGLVLQSTFTSALDLARAQAPLLPVSLLFRHPFLTRDRASAIDCPQLILHGDADPIIDVSHGRALSGLFPKASYVEVKGVGHNDAMLTAGRAGPAYYEFLSTVSPM